VNQPPDCQLHLNGSGVLEVTLIGDWLTDFGIRTPDTNRLQGIHSILVNADHLNQWDSALIVYLKKLWDEAHQLNLEVRTQSLTADIIALIDLSRAVPAPQQSTPLARKPSLLRRLFRLEDSALASADNAVRFLGDAAIALTRFAKGHNLFRQKDLWQYIYDAGPASLPIITLISVIIGMIMAFVGAVQLKQFGAEVFVASLVGLAMSREMAALMTGIIMAGRTGASYAAQIGSMQANEEIDALKTMGVIPFDFLVLPRLIALTFMMPLLTLYSMLLGLLGGALVAVVMLDVPLQLYFSSMAENVDWHHYHLGLLKSVIFGIIIALCGCYKGLKCGRNATAVGRATTEAVVVSIVLIIVTDCITAIITTLVGS
jgi:phospholipid/cholesterol/gamma-HCH transport system permease protein